MEVNNRVQIILQNAISAQFILRYKNKRVVCFTRILQVLTICVPVSTLFLLNQSQGTEFQLPVEKISGAISVALLIVSILGLIFKLDDSKEAFSRGIQNNRIVEEQARNLLNEKDSQKLEYFYSYVAHLDIADSESIGTISSRLLREAYREVLRKGDITGERSCPHCNKFPYEYKWYSFIKRCNTCGNLKD